MLLALSTVTRIAYLNLITVPKNSVTENYAVVRLWSCPSCYLQNVFLATSYFPGRQYGAFRLCNKPLKGKCKPFSLLTKFLVRKLGVV